MDLGTSPTDAAHHPGASTTSHPFAAFLTRLALTSSSTSSIEINDALFCEHGKEVCETCEFDGREDNDAVMGFDPAPRAPIELPAYYRNAKDNNIVCKAHGNNECKQCFNWKKTIQKLQKESKKAGKKNKDTGGSNF